MSNNVARRQHAVNTSGENTPSEIQQRTEAGDAFSALVVQIFRLSGLILSTGDALAEPTGQTSARWRVLAAIEDKPASVAQIARRWGQARQSVQRVANALVRDELATYEENPRHRRAKLLALTPKGRSVLQAIQVAQTAWANQLGTAIGEADLGQASAILARLLDLLHNQR